MTASGKKVLPLAAKDGCGPSSVSDALPMLTLPLANVQQRAGFGRKKRITSIAVEAIKRPRRVHEIDAVEAAFFPRFFWAMQASFGRDDLRFVETAEALRADMHVYFALMMPNQQADFSRELENAAFAAMEPMLDRRLGNAGGWDELVVSMTGFLLIRWVDQHAAQAMFTTNFERIAQGILAHLDEMYGGECDAAEDIAHQKLPKVIARLKSCGLFKWLPHYPGEATHVR